jgi:hypothetical protein
MLQRRTTPRAITASLALGLLALVPAPVAAAGPAHPPGVEPSDVQLMAAQVPLDLLRDRVQQVPEAAAGLAGVEVSPATSSVTVYWRGALPADVTALLGQAEAAASIQVTVKPAPYSQRQLEARIDQLVAARAQYHQQGIDFDLLQARVDGTGLDVQVLSGPGMAPATRAQLTQPALAGQLGGGLPVRVIVTTGGSVSDRFNDYAPHWAGARIVAANNLSHYCTSGFPIRRNSDGRTFITTAGHCGGTPWWAASDVNGNNIYKFGDTWNVTQTLDVQYIRSTSIEGDTYDGGVKIGTEFHKPVGGAQRSGRGDSVCQSGSATGVHCGIQVTGQATVIEQDTGWAVPMYIGQAGNNQVANGKGDSGGPVFSLLPASHVQARGEGVYQWDPTFIYTNNNGEQIVASSTFGFVDEVSILDNYGSSIVTG